MDRPNILHTTKHKETNLTDATLDQCSTTLTLMTLCQTSRFMMSVYIKPNLFTLNNYLIDAICHSELHLATKIVKNSILQPKDLYARVFEI